MSAYPKSSLAAYRSVAAHGGVDAADPHRLITLLMDGALERLASARGAIEHGDPEARNRLIHRTVAIVEELRASLNMEGGGQIAANLSDLYEYCGRQLLRANVENRAELLDEVGNLLREIRGAWVQIPAAARA
ncbi:MAG: flagellar export chaperone FliS [Pseudomonadota bacterium]|jgi:flagellar protein FliS|nr:MAG: flagellar export chaperone FliS [Pseudomonadota bacterium]